MSDAREVLSWHAELAGEVEPHPAFTLYRDSTALLVIDLQERLASAMPPKVWAQVQKNTEILLQIAARLGIPVITSEQYPKGLGPTVEGVREQLPEGAVCFEKTDFCCGDRPELTGTLKRMGRRQIIVVGQETHICVFQTVRQLVEQGYFVHVVQDGCCSRTKQNWQAGLSLMSQLGATVTTTEVVAFDLVKSADHPDFKFVSKLVK